MTSITCLLALLASSYSYGLLVAKVPLGEEGCLGRLALLSPSSFTPIIRSLSLVAEVDPVEEAEGEAFVLAGYRDEYGFSPAELAGFQVADRAIPLHHRFTVEYRDSQGQLWGRMRFVSTTPVTYWRDRAATRHRLPFFQKAESLPEWRGWEDRYPQAVEIGRNHTASHLLPTERLRVLLQMFRAGLMVLHELGKKDHVLVVEGMPHNRDLFEHIGILREVGAPTLSQDRSFHTRPILSLLATYVSGVDWPIIWSANPGEPWWGPANRFRERARNHSFPMPRFAALVEPELRFWRGRQDEVAESAAANPEDLRLLYHARLLEEIETRFSLISGQGDADAAIAFLQSPQTRARFPRVLVDSRGSEDHLTYWTGLVQVLSGDERGAAASLQLIKPLAPIRAYGDSDVEELDLAYGPLSTLTRDQAIAQLAEIDTWRVYFPRWLSAPIHARRAALYRRSGQEENAAVAERMARTLQ